MAKLTNENVNANGTKEYATDEKGMMADARDYAKRDMSTVIAVFEKAGLKPVQKVEDPLSEISMELVVKSVVAVKFDQIKKARTERPIWESMLDDGEE